MDRQFPGKKMNRNIKENIYLKALSRTTASFCKESSLHGINYIMKDIHEMESSHSRERKIQKLISLTIWITTCVIGAVFAVIMMILIWTRFQTTPTITTVETNNYPISNVEFPAVTICNINKVYRPATQNITQKLLNHGIAEDVILDFYSKLGTLISPEYIDISYINTYQLLEEMGYTTEKLMYELMQPCDRLIQKCTWLGKLTPCNTMFRVAKSSEGFCCSFNYKSLKYSLEINSSDTTVFEQLENPVHHVHGAGEYVGLQVLLQIETDQYMANTKSFYGADILIHEPNDYPQSTVTYSIAQPSFDLSIAVIPSVVVSEPGIRYLPISQRVCLFDDEKKLRTTNTYGFANCMTECTVDSISSKCGCIPFYFTELNHPIYSKLYRQCTLNDVKCLRDNRHVFASLQSPSEQLTEENVGMVCNCLPSCSEQRYEVQTIVSNRFDCSKLVTPLYYSDIELTNYTTVNVHFKDINCIKYRRDMYMTWDGLFASFGGIFGLCLGGSVISLVEIIYFFTFRYYSYVKNIRKKNHKSSIVLASHNANINQIQPIRTPLPPPPAPPIPSITRNRYIRNVNVNPILIPLAIDKNFFKQHNFEYLS